MKLFPDALKLFSLYDEKYPLPVPKGKSASRKLSAAAIYVHLSRKMATQSGENSKDLTLNQFGFTLPIALKEHYDYLRSLSKNEDFGSRLEAVTCFTLQSLTSHRKEDISSYISRAFRT